MQKYQVRSVVVSALLVVSSVGAQGALPGKETTLIDDPLRGQTKGTLVGGSFSPEGYRPGLGQNHILYELPRTVRAGYVEFEVKGMDAAAVPKEGDHGFLGMYDGRGVTEPATYSKDLKLNFYRWNVHWRQNRNAMKCVISCAAPGAEREQAASAQFEEKKRDWTHEPMGETVKWDPAKWHRLRVEWKDKTFRVLVDGVEKWRAEGPHDYAPVKHRIWLGCAPASGDKYPCMVEDIVYRNFKVVAYSTKSTSISGVPPAPPLAEPENPTVSFKDDFEHGLGKPWTFPRTAELWTKDWVSHAPSRGRNGSSGVRLRSEVNRPVHAVIGDFSQPASFREKQRLIVETDVKIDPENRLKLGLFVKGNYFIPPRKLGPAGAGEVALYHNGYAFVIAPKDVTRLEHNVWLIRKCEEGGLHAKCGQMQKELGDRHVAGTTHPIENGRWYRLRLEIEGLEFTAYIDDKKVIEYKETENLYARDQHHVALYVHRNNHKPGQDDYEGDIYDKTHIGSGIFDNVVVAFAPAKAKAKTAAKEPARARQSSADYFPQSDDRGGWRTLKDADEIRRTVGMDKQKFDEAFQLIQGATKNGGLLIARHGWLVYEPR